MPPIKPSRPVNTKRVREELYDVAKGLKAGDWRFVMVSLWQVAEEARVQNQGDAHEGERMPGLAQQIELIADGMVGNNPVDWAVVGKAVAAFMPKLFAPQQ